MKKISTIFLSLLLISGVFASGADDLYKEDPFLKEFAVYPNPTHGELTVSLETFNDSQPLKLKVYSVIGQEIESVNLSPFSGQHNVRLDLQKYPKGVYMIEVSNGVQTKTKRVSVI